MRMRQQRHGGTDVVFSGSAHLERWVTAIQVTGADDGSEAGTGDCR